MSVAEGTSPQPEQVVTVEHEGLVRLAARRFRRHRLAMLGLVMLLTVVAIAVFLPLIVPLDPILPDYNNIRQPPSAEHPLGGDISGRDVWARVVHGARVSLVAGFGALDDDSGTLKGGVNLRAGSYYTVKAASLSWGTTKTIRLIQSGLALCPGLLRSASLRIW